MTIDSKKYRKALVLTSVSAFLVAIYCNNNASGAYTSSSHGDSTNGVNRSSIIGYATGNCAHCHEQHASIGGVEPVPTAGSAAGPDIYLGFDVEENLCYRCHGNGGEGGDTTYNIQNVYANNPHGGAGPAAIGATGRHEANETVPADFTGAQRHSECMDCHNPHEATAIDNADPLVGPIIGASGIQSTYAAAAGVSPTFGNVVAITDAFDEYMICFKCHSNWAGPGTTDVEFNPNNESYHWVVNQGSMHSNSDNNAAAGLINTAEFNTASRDGYIGIMMPRYLTASNTNNHATFRAAKLRCSDCHGPNNVDNGTTPAGVHGSTMASILKYPTGSAYTSWDATTGFANAWCFNCHASNFTGTGFDGPDGQLHALHSGQATNGANLCQTCHLTTPHGGNDRQHMLNTTQWNNNIDTLQSGNYPEAGGHTAGNNCN